MDKDTLFYKKQTIQYNGNILPLNPPLVMGILNVTPDSFYDGGSYATAEKIEQRIDIIFSEGADIIDIGAFSSRPGASFINEKEEISRLAPALEITRNKYPGAVLSVDTFRTGVAKWAIENFKCAIINDISAGTFEPEIIDCAARNKVAFVAMHMQGKPETMQDNPHYQHIITELLDYFAHRVAELRSRGVNDVIIDPGFGFGKTISHNYQLVAALDVFQMLEVPLMVGISRKSMVYKQLGITAEEALAGTIVLQALALQKGASILRVHDVKEAVQTISIFKKLSEESEKSINLLK
jgi:dihydropteroate synthase